ncbi:MAG: dTDP-glucose 4,6-dehydratase [Bacillota bacterium]|nr:dTDP-glucose 4,6-dehydratase [Bacillota bacterium]
MHTYCITGGCGFIGSNFVRYLLNKYGSNITIINVDCLTYAGNPLNLKDIWDEPRYFFRKIDICDKSALKKLFKEFDINYIVNFAAESHVDRSIQNPEAFVSTNITGTYTLLETARQSWETEQGFLPERKFIQISTDEVYGSLGKTGCFTENSPLAPRSPYSASKASADLLVKAYSDTYNLPVNITRCSNNYGPYQFPEKLIPLVINNCLNGSELPVYGDGKNIRDWLYVEDHCGAIDLVINKGLPGEVYNIGGQCEKQNIEIIKAVIRIISGLLPDSKNIGEVLIKYVNDRKGHDRRYAIDSSKIRKELGWYPQTGFEEGILETVKWYLDNRDWLLDVTSGQYNEYYKQMYKGK